MAEMLIDGEKRDVGDKPITLMCHKGDVHIAAVDQVEIGPMQTLERAKALSQEEWESIRDLPPFIKMFKAVFHDQEVPSRLSQEGMGTKHVVGMIVMLLEVINDGKQPFLRYPESYLHPKYQSGLADLFSLLTKGEL